MSETILKTTDEILRQLKEEFKLSDFQKLLIDNGFPEINVDHAKWVVEQLKKHYLLKFELKRDEFDMDWFLDDMRDFAVNLKNGNWEGQAFSRIIPDRCDKPFKRICKHISEYIENLIEIHRPTDINNHKQNKKRASGKVVITTDLDQRSVVLLSILMTNHGITKPSIKKGDLALGFEILTGYSEDTFRDKLSENEFFDVNSGATRATLEKKIEAILVDIKTNNIQPYVK